MWTKQSRGRMADIAKKTKRYPSDLTDEEWERIAREMLKIGVTLQVHRGNPREPRLAAQPHLSRSSGTAPFRPAPAQTRWTRRLAGSLGHSLAQARDLFAIFPEVLGDVGGLGIAHMDVQERGPGVVTIHRGLGLFFPGDGELLFRGESSGIHMGP